jgi:hypothetical protein
MTRCERIRLALLLSVSVLMLGACATAPVPMTELAAADAAIGAAREARAAEFAPVEFGFAEDKRRAAEAALDSRDNAAARDLARQAEADAALAEAKSRAAIGRNAVQQKTRENAELRRELLGGDRP